MSRFPRIARRAVAAALTTAALASPAAPSALAAPTESVQPVFAIAAILSGAPDDFHVNNSITDALESLRGSDLVSGHTFDFVAASPAPADAAAQIMQYGAEPWGVVLVTGPYQDAVLAAAQANPQRSFVYVPDVVPADGINLPANVSVVTPEAADGGSVLGAIAGALGAQHIRVLSTEVEGVTPPAQPFNEAFVQATPSPESTEVVAPLGSLAAVDLLVVNRPVSADEAAAMASSGIPLLANAADLSELADTVVASSVYRWDVAIREIVGGIVHGDLGGEAHLLDLANGGIEIRVSDGAASVAGVAEAAISAIVPPTTVPPTTPVDGDTATEPDTANATPANPVVPTAPAGQPASTAAPTTAPGTAAPTTAPAPPAATEPPAPSIGGCEGLGVGTANQWRANVGAPALTAAGLGACSWAQHMAETQSMSHAGGQPGEVVYSGYSCSDAWSGWANSASHYNLIVSPDYSLGDFQCVRDSSGVVWAVGRLSW